MPLSNYALDTFVAQELSTLTECQVQSVASDFSDYESWLQTFVLNAIFHLSLPAGKRALVLAVIRRVQEAVLDYEEGRQSLLAFLSDRNGVSRYFRALTRFESVVAYLYQAIDIIRKALGEIAFEKGDGSTFARLNQVYNESRHSMPEELPEGHLHVVWLRNEGLCTAKANLSFDELRDVLHQLCSISAGLAKGESSAST